MTSCNRGDVVLVLFPYANLTGYKKRPALVVQDQNVPTGFNDRVVVMITSNTARTGLTRIPVAKSSVEGQQMGLLTDSVIAADHIATLEDRMIDKAIGHCPRMSAVDSALRRILGL